MPDPKMSPEVQRVGREIQWHLGEIAELFKPGVKLTFLARHPDSPYGTADMVLTDDTLFEAIAALEIRRVAEEAEAPR